MKCGKLIGMLVITLAVKELNTDDAMITERFNITLYKQELIKLMPFKTFMIPPVSILYQHF